MPAPATDESFGSILAHYARGALAHELAVVYGDTNLSWAELHDRSSRRAAQLLGLGVKPDDFVAVAMPNVAAFHEVVFAIWKAGATPCVVSARLPETELRDILALASPRVLFGQLPYEIDGVVQLDPSRSPPEAAFELPDLSARCWKAVASGGSTGRPKLIVDHAPSRFGEPLRATARLLGIPEGGTLINPGPLYHNAALLFTTLALLSGSRVVGTPRFDAEETLRLIEAYRGEWVGLVPTMMHRIWSLPETTRARYDLSSLRSVWHLAAACPAWLKRCWIDWLGPERVWELYAGTETPGTVISGDEWLSKPGSVGRVPTETLDIRRPDTSRCRPGEVGEIFFAPESLERFHYVGAPAPTSIDGRFSLGDLGYVDEDGYLFLADRRADLILRGGANVYPAEVEAVLDQHPSVASSLVIGLPDDEYGQRVHALLQLGGEPAPDLREVDAFVRGRLSGYKCPESYEIIASALRDDAGKARRSAIKAERESWLSSGRRFGQRLQREPS